MNVFLFGVGIGTVIGGIVIGIIANRRPAWFAHVVTMANSIDDKVNTKVAPAVQTAANKIGL